MNLCPTRKINAGYLNSTTRYPYSFCCTSMFPIKFCYHLKKLYWNVSNNFHSFIDFCRVYWNGMFWMFTVLIFQLCQAFKFFASGILILPTMKTFSKRFNFYKSDKPSLLPMQEDRRQAIFILLRKKTFYCLNFKILKALVECWHIQIAAEYLSMSRNHRISREFLSFLRNYLITRGIFYLN